MNERVNDWVLIADDDDDDRYLYKLALSDLQCTSDYKIQFAVDGVDLLRRLEAGEGLPSIIFLDLNMPQLDGLQCLSRIREIYDATKVPVVIFSTSDNEQDIEESFRLGANLFIQKPTDYNAIQDVFISCICKDSCKTEKRSRDAFFVKAA